MRRGGKVHPEKVPPKPRWWLQEHHGCCQPAGGGLCGCTCLPDACYRARCQNCCKCCPRYVGGRKCCTWCRVALWTFPVLWVLWVMTMSYVYTGRLFEWAVLWEGFLWWTGNTSYAALCHKAPSEPGFRLLSQNMVNAPFVSHGLVEEMLPASQKISRAQNEGLLDYIECSDKPEFLALQEYFALTLDGTRYWRDADFMMKELQGMGYYVVSDSLDENLDNEWMGSGLVFASRYPITFSAHLDYPWTETVMIKDHFEYNKLLMYGAQINVVCVNSTGYSATASCPSSSRLVLVNTHIYPEQAERGFRIRKAQIQLLVDYLKENGPDDVADKFWEMPIILAGDLNIDRYGIFGGTEHADFYTASGGYFGTDISWSDLLMDLDAEGNTPSKSATMTYPPGKPNFWLGESGSPTCSLDYVLAGDVTAFTPVASITVQPPVPEDARLYLTRKLTKYPINDNGEPIVSDHNGILATFETASGSELSPPAYSSSNVGGTLAFPEWENETVFQGSWDTLYDFWIAIGGDKIHAYLCEESSIGYLIQRNVHNACGDDA